MTNHNRPEDVDHEIREASVDGFGATILGPLDSDAPEPSEGELALDDEQDTSGNEGDEGLLSSGSSPEFEHLRKTHHD